MLSFSKFGKNVILDSQLQISFYEVDTQQRSYHLLGKVGSQELVQAPQCGRQGPHIWDMTAVS